MLYISLPSWLNYAVMRLRFPPSLHLGHLGSNQSNPVHFNVCRDTALFITLKALRVCHRLLLVSQGGFTHCSASEIPIGYQWLTYRPWILLGPPLRRFKSSLLFLIIKVEPGSGGQKPARPTSLLHRHESNLEKWAIYFPDDWYDLKAFKMCLRWMLSLKQLEVTMESLCPQIRIKKYNYLTIGIWWKTFLLFTFL